MYGKRVLMTCMSFTDFITWLFSMRRSLLLGRQPCRSGSFARMDSVESNLTARSPSIEDLKCFEAPKHPKIQVRI